MISTPDDEAAEKAKSMIMDICFEPVVGETYEGTVVNIIPIGAFVQIRHGVDGMIHISKLSEKRVEKVEDVVKLGDRVKVSVLKIDDKGRIDLKLVEKIG